MDYFFLVILFLVLGTLGAGWVTNRLLTAAGYGHKWRIILLVIASILPIVVILAVGGRAALVYLFFPIATLVVGWITHWTLTAAGTGLAWRMVLSWIASMLPAAVYAISVYPFPLNDPLQAMLALSLLWIPLLLFLEWRHSRIAKRNRLEHALHS